MVIILTSNIVPEDNIFQYHDNFIFSLIHTQNMIPLKNKKEKYIFDIFFQDGFDLGDEFNNSSKEPTIQYNHHPCATVEDALSQIAEIVSSIDFDNTNRNEDLQDEIMFGVFCNKRWNRDIVKYLNNSLSDLDSELTALNLYQYMKFTNMDDIVKVLKIQLGSEFIYPEEPVSFGYAIYQILRGVR